MSIHYSPPDPESKARQRPDDKAGHDANDLGNKWRGARQSRQNYEKFLNNRLLDPLSVHILDISRTFVIASAFAFLLFLAVSFAEFTISQPIFEVLFVWGILGYIILESYIFLAGMLIGEFTPFHVLSLLIQRKRQRAEGDVKAAIRDTFDTRSMPSNLGSILLSVTVIGLGIIIGYGLYRISALRVELQIAAGEITAASAIENTLLPIFLPILALIFAIPGHFFPFWIGLTLNTHRYNRKYTELLRSEQTLEDSARRLYSDHIRQVEDYNQNRPAGTPPMMPVPANTALLGLLRGPVNHGSNETKKNSDDDDLADADTTESQPDPPPADNGGQVNDTPDEADEDDLEDLVDDSIFNNNLKP
jgi:hypothetical protein